MRTLLTRAAEVRRRVTFHPRRGVRLGTKGLWLELPDALTALALELEHALSRPVRAAPPVGFGGRWLRRQLVARGVSYHCFEPDFRVVRTGADGRFVTDGTTRLWVRDESALRPAHAASGEAVALELPCGRPNLSPGRFTLVSRAGRPRTAAPVELVVGTTAEGALEAVDRLLLERLPAKARFVAEVRDDEARLPATDGLTLLVEPADARPFLFWLRGLLAESPRLFLREAHPLAQRAGLGLGLGARPDAPSESPLGPAFLGHRLELMAQALLRSAVTGAPLATCLRQRFSAARLSWAHPAWGPGGPPPWSRW